MGPESFPHVIKPGETFTISVPMPFLGCDRCGGDLRGKQAVLDEPVEDVDRKGWPIIVYLRVVCATCDEDANRDVVSVSRNGPS